MTDPHSVAARGEPAEPSELDAAAIRARERFRQVEVAFADLKRAHERGDFSESGDFLKRIDAFRVAAAEVHRIAQRNRRPDPG